MCPGEVLVAAVWFVVAYIAVFATASVGVRLLIGHIDMSGMSEVLSICVFIQLSKHFRGH